MDTHFVVKMGIDCYTVAVDAKDYMGTAIVLVECLKHYRGMEHMEAVMWYVNGTKELTEGHLVMDDVSVDVAETPSKFTDLIIFAPTNTIEYWQDYGNLTA